LLHETIACNQIPALSNGPTSRVSRNESGSNVRDPIARMQHAKHLGSEYRPNLLGNRVARS
jgi:hypothetical protein